MEKETDIVVREETNIFSLPDTAELKKELDIVRRFQTTVKELLIEGHDFGVIPGTGKPTLLKPGAEKIDKILHLADTYEEVDNIEDWDKPLFYYKIKCRLIIIGTNVVVSEGMGSCNSMEGRYRYRWVFGSEVPDNVDKSTLLQSERKSRKTGQGYIMYRLENEDVYTLANTILKMAKKRAHIDASLSAGRLSDIFTQDLEDIVEEVTPAKQTKEKRVEKAKPEPSPEATSPDFEGVNPKDTTDTPEEEMVGKINKEWLLESISKLKMDILRHIKEKYGIELKGKEGLFDVVAKLNEEQQAELVKEIQDRLEML